MSQTEEQLQFYERYVHEKNRKRIQWGIRVLLVGPLVFVALMMTMNSNKNIYLLLWIVSLFVIAAYLISVEYMDFQMQQKLRQIGVPGLREPLPGSGEEEARGLIDEATLPKGFLALEKLENDIIEGNLKELSEHTDQVKPEKADEQFYVNYDSIEVVVRENGEHPCCHEEPKEDLIETPKEREVKKINILDMDSINSIEEKDPLEGKTELEKADYLLQQAIKAKVEAEVKARIEKEIKDKMSGYIDQEVENLSKVISSQIMGDQK